MMSVKAFVADFLEMFKGNQMSHGLHTPEKETKEGEKAPGKSSVIHEQVTEEIVAMHLHGKQGLGIIPIDHKNRVNFAVIDIDVYPANPKKYLNILRLAGIPSICFRSKSGGLHAFFFFSDSPEASKIRGSLMTIVGVLGLPKTVEVFPKQTMLEEGKTGNWINLPYFNAGDTERYAYDSDGKALNLSDALTMIKGVRQPYKQFIAAVDNAPMAKGPPCLQTMYLDGGAGEGERNHYLFNCAGYLKARYGEGYEEHLHEVNKRMENPIPFTELQTTIISSHNKSNYAYNCKSPVLSSYCNRDICCKREWGVSSENVTSLNFGLLKVFRASEDYYEWEINGKTLRFEDAKALENQSTFRTLCLKELHLPQHRMKDAKWVEVLKTAMDNIEILDAPIENMSTDNLWVHIVEKYCKDNHTTVLKEIDDGKVYILGEELILKTTPLHAYLSEQRAVSSLSGRRHNDMMRVLLKANFSNLGRKDYKGRAVVIDLALMNKKGLLLSLKDIHKKEEKYVTQQTGRSPIEYLEDYKQKF